MKLFPPALTLVLFACRSEDGVKAYNAQPQVTITSHTDGAQIQDGYVIPFVGQVSDANHQNTDLLVTWSTNNGDLCTEMIPETNGETICEGILTEEDTEVRLQAIDPEGSAGVQTISVIILPTEAPEARIISPVPSGVYYSDQLITFEGTINDAEDDAELLVANWESTIDGELNVESDANTEGSVLGYGYLSEGEHAVELHVEDTTGKTDTASVIINVGPPNSAPLCEITAPTTGSAGPENQNVDFMASVSDVDISSNQLTVSWNSDKDGDLGTSTPTSSGEVLFSFSDLSVNTHTITVTVTDEIGASCTDLVSYTVGTAPEITIDTPIDGDIISEGTPINFTATISDAQDQPSNVALDWVLNGVSVSTQGATTSGSATWSDATLPFGNYTLLVTATDTDGLTDSDQTTFTINGIPSAPEISITPDPATTTNQLSANIDTASVDPENTTISYTYEWFKNNVLQSTQTSSVITSSDTTKGEIWMVRVTPNDGISDGDFAEAQITITNTAPTLSSISITPTGSIYNDDVLTCSVIVSDPDETLTPSFEWSIDGSVIGTGATVDLGSVGAMPNDDVLCSAYVTDNEGESASSSTSKTLDNRSPILSGTSITPSAGITTSTLLTCTSTANDNDGESLTPTFAWQVGSYTYSGPTLQLDSTMVSPNESITCTVDVVDGYGASTSDSVSVTVENATPVVDSITLSPSNVYTNDTITATAVFSDDDGQTVSGTYAWHVIDVATGTDTEVQNSSDNTLIGVTYFDRDDEVYVIVTPNDGVDDGTPQTSSSITIFNTPPTGLTISSAPDPATTGQDDLVCSVNTPATDEDGDSVVYTYVWTDGSGTVQQTTSSTTSTSDIFLASGTSDGTWTCEVTPNDGTDNGASDSTVITVLTNCDETLFGIESLLVSGGDSHSNGTINDMDVVLETLTDGDVGHISGEETGNKAYNVCFFYDTNGSRTITLDITEGSSVSGLRYFSSNNAAQYGVVSPTNFYVTLLPSGTQVVQNESLNSGWNTFSFSEYTGVEQVEITFNKQSEHSCVSEIELTLSCDYTDADGDGVVAWEDCDDNNSSIITGTGTSERCAGTSCKTILDDGASTGNGIYWINPDGNTAFEAYCDMNTDGGGWTLLTNGGGDCQSFSCSTVTMTSLSSLSSTDTCSYLDGARVALIAANATDVALRVGTSFGNWSSTANSTNTLAITALQNPGQTWHNGATWDNWDWSHTGNPICATGWPNMYHASGNQSGVHWVVGDGLYQTWYPATSTVSSTWVR